MSSYKKTYFTSSVLSLSLFILTILNNVSLTCSMDLDDRVSNLFEMTRRQGLIKLNSAKFETYVRERPRNYSMIAMMTALNPSRGCTICKEANEEFKIVYNSFRQNNHRDFLNKNIFFAVIDYEDASDVFSQLKVNSAPGFFHFPASDVKTTKANKLDMNSKGFQATALGKWISDRTGVAIQIVRPPSYAGFMMVVAMLVMCGGLAYMSGFSYEWLLNKKIWALVSISIVLIMTSGQMWNHIRGPPPMGRTQHGMAFVARGSQQQYIFETYWVLIIYAAISIGTIILGDHAADTKQDNEVRRAMGMFGIAIFTVFYSFALATFRQKYQGYPYKLLF